MSLFHLRNLSNLRHLRSPLGAETEATVADANDIVRIPGTTRRVFFEENVAALDVSLTAADLSQIDAIAPRDVAAGPRYPEARIPSVNR